MMTTTMMIMTARLEGTVTLVTTTVLKENGDTSALLVMTLKTVMVMQLAARP